MELISEASHTTSERVHEIVETMMDVISESPKRTVDVANDGITDGRGEILPITESQPFMMKQVFHLLKDHMNLGEFYLRLQQHGMNQRM
jgi:hypothetical protein